MDVLLYATQNPRNLGAIVRTSAAFGIDRLYLYDRNGLLKDEMSIVAMMKSAREYWKYVDIVRLPTWEETMEFAHGHKERVATVVSKRAAKLDSPNCDLPLDALLMFGNEASGLPRELSRPHGTRRVTIPTNGLDACFSLPIAYGIFLFEYFRQHPNAAKGRKSHTSNPSLFF